MEIKFFRRLRNFLRTTLIGGIVALAPLTLIVLLFRWVITVIGRNLTPLVDTILQDPDPNPFFKLALYVITFTAVLLFFFIIGLVVRTRLTPSRVALDLIDDGCGMQQETAIRMFEPFFTTGHQNLVGTLHLAPLV